MSEDKIVDYAWRMQPFLNRDALFCDETELFRSPAEPEAGDTVTIRFRAARNNAREVYFISGAIREQMKVERAENGFDYYAIQITVGDQPICYYFEICQGRLTVYYNKLGVTRDLQEVYSFHIFPGFHVPEWAKGAVMYQIFIDRFCNGDASNDVVDDEYCYINEHVTHEKDWNALPKAMDVRNFYGGDLQGIIDKLDYLQDLGVEVLYLNPIFVSPSNHRYDTQDYDYVDPHIGRIVADRDGVLAPGDMNNSHSEKYESRVTDLRNLEASNQLFIELVEELHRRGMKIILDGVFNHCGSFNKWMDRERIYENRPGHKPGAYVSADSPYRNYFKFQNEHSWPYNEFYDGWWGNNTLPKLNYEESEKLQKDIYRVAAKWVSPPYNCDGWRLDVAADLGNSQEFNHRFWKEFRQVVKKANPNAVILAEHYGDARPWMQGDQWDSVMNYDAFMEPVSWFLTGMEKHSDQYREDMLGNSDCFADAMRYHMASFALPSLQCAMNELDNHDHSRFMTRTNHVVGRLHYKGAHAAEENLHPSVMRMAVVFQMFWPGCPTLYYGDEAGVCGFTDPDSRRSYPWGNEDLYMLEFYRRAIHLHNTYPMLRSGSVCMLNQEKEVLSFGRFDRDKHFVVAVNNSAQNRKLEVPVWRMGIDRLAEGKTMTRILYTEHFKYSFEEIQKKVTAGHLELELSPYSAVVYTDERELK